MNIKGDITVDFKEWELLLIQSSVNYYISKIKELDYYSSRDLNELERLQKRVNSAVETVSKINSELHN